MLSQESAPTSGTGLLSALRVAILSEWALARAALPDRKLDKTCGTGCHAVEVVTSQRMNAADWNAVVQNMVARGAQAPDGDLKAIVEYLSKTLGR
jgi:cytochrome c5